MAEIEEYLQLLAELSIPGESYDPVDRYRDFRTVFLETDEGRRVLRQILGWGNLLKGHLVGQPHPLDANHVLAMEGQRNLALHIFSVMVIEPPQRPTKQTTAQTD